KSVDVKQRNHEQITLCATLRELVSPRISLYDVSEDVSVREHRAFRHSGCSARVLQHRDVLLSIDFNVGQIRFGDTGEQIRHSYRAFNYWRWCCCSRVLPE